MAAVLTAVSTLGSAGSTAPFGHSRIAHSTACGAVGSWNRRFRSGVQLKLLSLTPIGKVVADVHETLRPCGSEDGVNGRTTRHRRLDIET
jgi:hypothetical protein